MPKAVLTRLKEQFPRLLRPANAHSQPRGSRLWVWLLGVFLGLYTLYVAAATAFVCLGGMTWVTQSEEDIRIDVASGYSLLPGRMHLKSVRVQFKDYNVEMSIFAEEAQLSIALLRLMQKRIHLHWVRASGVDFQTLHRVRDRDKSSARLALFPDIPAFDRPPFYDAPRSPRSGKKPWSLQVDSIEAEAHSVWVMEYKLRGKIHGKGAFYTDPLHEAAVLPCHATISEATVSLGKEQIAHDVEGSLSFELSPFTVSDAPIEKVLPKISARVGDFSARIDSFSFVQLYLSKVPLRVDGRGELKIDTAVARGKVESGSTLSLEISPWIFLVQGEGKDQELHSTQGSGQIALHAGPFGHVNLVVRAQVPRIKNEAFSVENLQISAALHQRDVTTFHVEEAKVDLRNLQYDRPDFLYALLGNHHPAVPTSGKFHLQGEAALPEERPKKLKLQLETLSTSFYFKGQRFGATAETSLSCQGTPAAAECDLDFHAPYLLVDRKPDAEAVEFWLRLKTPKPLQLSAERGSFEGAFVVSGGDPKEAISDWMGQAWLPQMGLKLVPTGPITGSFTARRTPSEFSLSGINIVSGKTELEGELTSGETVHAVGTLKMPTGRWGFETTPAGVRVQPFVGQKWLGKQ